MGGKGNPERDQHDLKAGMREDGVLDSRVHGSRGCLGLEYRFGESLDFR